VAVATDQEKHLAEEGNATTRGPRGLSWEEMEAVNRADRRRDFRELTPGQRLEQAFELSELALRLQEAFQAERRGRERQRA
jgi:hypothetical protein